MTPADGAAPSKGRAAGDSQSRALSGAKRSLSRLLANPRAGQRMLRISQAQTKAVVKALGTAQRFEGFVAANLPDAEETPEEQHARLLRYYAHLREHVATLPLQPTISVLVPVYRPDPGYLREALNSVAVQTYPNWQLCIVDDASGDPEVTAVIQDFAEAYPDQVRVEVHRNNQHISAASNTALMLASGEYVTLLDHDDRLYPHALGEVVRRINAVAAADGTPPEILYSDERVVGPDGEDLHGAFHKPGWSPFLHLSVNYTTHLSVYSRELLDRIGGFRVGFEGAQDHDLMVRAVEASDTPVQHIADVLYQWRSHPASTAGDDGAKPYAWDAGIRAITEACDRRGRPAQVTQDPDTGHYRLAFQLPEPRPRVSVVIPNKNSTGLLQACVHSVMRASTYPDIELVIVDNGSTDPSTLDFYDQLQAEFPDAKVLFDSGYFNFARLNNLGAREASGEYLVLLNNDTEVITPDWLEQMLMYAQFDEIGAVGARLLYPDGSVQHGGIVGAGANIADHTGWHSRPEDALYLNMVNTVHEALAVTAAALMVRRESYLKVGGFDEEHVPNGFGDVDLCLRLREDGLTNIYTPYATLLHRESVTRARNVEQAEIQYMRRRWGGELLDDPYLNPNFARSGQYAPAGGMLTAEIDADLFRRWLTEGRIS